MNKLGETGNYYKIIKEQQDHNVIIGRKYSNLGLEYKINGTQIIKPEILILGTSRVMLFKQEMFLPNKIYMLKF